MACGQMSSVAPVGLGAHAGAIVNFADGVGRAAASGADLAAPFGFWVFFATMHPLARGRAGNPASPSRCGGERARS